MNIGNVKIGPLNPPFLIAEMSGNHNGDISTAFRIMEAAKKSGADAVKIQTYRPDTMTINHDGSDFQLNDGPWKGWKLFDLYDWAQTPWEWHKPLFEYANEIGITMFSTPFDQTAVDLLEKFDVPAYKIASFEIIDLNLIRYVASTGKPVIISTGMANIEEIHEAIDVARSGGCTDLTLLHCVSGYPAPAEDYNLRTIPDMMSRFSVNVGLSDHTLDNTTAITSVAFGATIIEKHFTLNRSAGGPDDSFSLEPNEFSELSRDTKVAWASIGSIDYKLKSSEIGSLKFRRSLYFVKELKVGETITADCVRVIRPGYGLAPKYLDHIIGRRVKADVAFGTAVNLDIIDID